MKLLRLNRRWSLTNRLDGLTGIHAEPVIQDIDVPIARARIRLHRKCVLRE